MNKTVDLLSPEFVKVDGVEQEIKAVEIKEPNTGHFRQALRAARDNESELFYFMIPILTKAIGVDVPITDSVLNTFKVENTATIIKEIRNFLPQGFSII